MDAQTVTALCNLMLVFIGIVGLVLARKECRTVLATKKKPGPREGKPGLI